MARLREVPFDGEGWGLCCDGDRLVRSDGTGRLILHDLADLLGGERWPRTKIQVLNGIAHIEGREFLLTGKWWPSMFRVRLEPAP